MYYPLKYSIFYLFFSLSFSLGNSFLIFFKFTYSFLDCVKSTNKPLQAMLSLYYCVSGFPGFSFIFSYIFYLSDEITHLIMCILHFPLDNVTY